MAFEFPQATVYGVDIGKIIPIHSPSLHTYHTASASVAPVHPPNNIVFEMHDINAPLMFQDGSIDLVHARSVSMNVRKV